MGPGFQPSAGLLIQPSLFISMELGTEEGMGGVPYCSEISRGVEKLGHSSSHIGSENASIAVELDQCKRKSMGLRIRVSKK